MSDKSKPAGFIGAEGSEMRGDKIYVTARKFNKARLIRRTDNHHASEMVIEKDARAKLLRAYTSTRN